MIEKSYTESLNKEIKDFSGLLMGKKTKEALGLIEEAYLNWFKLNPSMLEDLEEDQLITFFSEEKSFNIYELEFLAEIMTQEGRIHFNENETEKTKNILKKALILFEFVDKELATYDMDRQTKMKQIKNQLTALVAE